MTRWRTTASKSLLSLFFGLTCCNTVWHTNFFFYHFCQSIRYYQYGVDENGDAYGEDEEDEEDEDEEDEEDEDEEEEDEDDGDDGEK